MSLCSVPSDRRVIVVTDMDGTPDRWLSMRCVLSPKLSARRWCKCLSGRRGPLTRHSPPLLPRLLRLFSNPPLHKPMKIHHGETLALTAAAVDDGGGRSPLARAGRQRAIKSAYAGTPVLTAAMPIALASRCLTMAISSMASGVHGLAGIAQEIDG